MKMPGKIAVIGLGYVGLPLAVAFAREYPDVVGFDTNRDKVKMLLEGTDPTGSVHNEDIKAGHLRITSSEEEIKSAAYYIVAVPTPVDSAHCPDLSYLMAASGQVGRVMGNGATVCYESTVYPGVTEAVCAPILTKESGLRPGVDFKIGYSPERINPGDRSHNLETVVKVVSGEDAGTAERLAALYGKIVKAGIHIAPSIRVAEAAKVIENTQRDLNIALMNELALIFDRINLRTVDVLKVATTKWNFLPFFPGLVGGHCIGVDPYYLTYKAEETGYIPQVILAGRRINDGMGKFVAEKTIKLMCRSGAAVRGSRVGVMGLAFKEDVSDLRNSKVPDIVRELEEYGVCVRVHDPLGSHREALEEYGIALCAWEDFQELDAVVLAVGHRQYLSGGPEKITAALRGGKGVLVDVKALFSPSEFDSSIVYWSL